MSNLTQRDIEQLTNILQDFFSNEYVSTTDVYNYVRKNSLFSVHPSVIENIMKTNGYEKKILTMFVKRP